MPIKGVSGVIFPQPGNWDRLTQVIQSVWSRLSDLEGRTGTSKRYADLSMEGSKLTNGPQNQSKADDREYITKAYLQSSEAANTIHDGMTNAGVVSSAVKLRVVDGGASPSQPDMTSGEIIAYQTPSGVYLVFYDGTQRHYFLKSGTDLY